MAYNLHVISTSGGLHNGGTNLRYDGSLYYLLDSVSGEIFGNELYPTIATKAARLCDGIVTGHLFNDGNKRTGTLTFYSFLKANGHTLLATHAEMEEMVLGLASGAVDVDEWADWVTERCQELLV